MSDHERQMRRSLVEQAKIDLEKLTKMPDKMETTQKLIKDSRIMQLYDEFIGGAIPLTTFALNLKHTANDILESLQEHAAEASSSAAKDAKKRRKKHRRKGKKQD